jgi:hypothetical protein
VDPVRPILIRDVFTHTARSTYNFLEDTPVSKRYLDAGLLSEGEASMESVIAELARLLLAYQPGSRGITACQLMSGPTLSKFGRPLQDVLKERVFSPLGMSDTSFSVSSQNCSPGRRYVWAS